MDEDGSVSKVNTTPEETQRRVTEKILRRGHQAVEKRGKALQKLVVEYVPVTDVHPNRYNPNRQSPEDFELLLRSMEEDGFTQPIVVQQDGTIVDGEHRWRAARELGYTEVPVVRVDMNPEQMRIATLRHNRARGSEDIDLSAQVLADLQALGAIDWAQDSLMLSDDELNRMLNEVSAPDSLAAEQYGQTWVPVPKEDGAEADSRQLSDGSVAVGASSLLAAEGAKKREALMAAAKTDGDRQKAVEQTRQVRLCFAFSPAQGEVVGRVLGDRPAERLYALCVALQAEVKEGAVGVAD